MAGIDTSIRRAIAVIALLVLAVCALRGYLPGVERELARERTATSPLALYLDVALLSGAVVVIGIAIIARMRDGRARRPPSGIEREAAARRGRPTWRLALLALAVIIGWLAMVTVLTRLAGPEPGEQSTVAVSEPGTPARDPAASREPRRPPPDSGTNVVTYLVPPMLVLLALVVTGTVVVGRRQRRADRLNVSADGDRGPSPMPPATESLARAAELGLAEIGDLSREPREAIIACYAAMERELTHVPGAAPQAFDTPTEVLARAVARHALNADSATQLVELFEESRFSPHVMTEQHRDVAVRVLRLVLGELRSMA
ncbi:DUF4129 domain-containing protein [Mycobacterium sp. URHB0021]|jgi:uncharacterized protein DUF4129